MNLYCTMEAWNLELEHILVTTSIVPINTLRQNPSALHTFMFKRSWPDIGETDLLTSITSLVAIQNSRLKLHPKDWNSYSLQIIFHYLQTCQINAADNYNGWNAEPRYYSAWINLLSTSIIFRWVFWIFLIVSISLNVKAVLRVSWQTSR